MAGSIGNLASSATVAASSFDMQAADPTIFINRIDPERWNQIKRRKPATEDAIAKFHYVEPAGESEEAAGDADEARSGSAPNVSSDLITGKVQVLGEYIDTDAVCIFALLPCFGD